MTNKKSPPNYRDASTGRFVTKRYAEQHLTATEKEHNRPARKSPPKC